MTDTTNRLSKSGAGWRMFAIFSGLDENEARDATVLFVYEPDENQGLRAVLRAKPVLLPMIGGAGQVLGFEFELTGTDKSNKASHGGVGLGTDIRIDPGLVAAALAKNLNPIVEVLLGQPPVEAEFCKGSEAMAAIVQKHRIARSIPIPSPAATLPAGPGSKSGWL